MSKSAKMVDEVLPHYGSITDGQNKRCVINGTLSDMQKLLQKVLVKKWNSLTNLSKEDKLKAFLSSVRGDYTLEDLDKLELGKMCLFLMDKEEEYVEFCNERQERQLQEDLDKGIDISEDVARMEIEIENLSRAQLNHQLALSRYKIDSISRNLDISHEVHPFREVARATMPMIARYRKDVAKESEKKSTCRKKPQEKYSYPDSQTVLSDSDMEFNEDEADFKKQAKDIFDKSKEI